MKKNKVLKIMKSKNQGKYEKILASKSFLK